MFCEHPYTVRDETGYITCTLCGRVIDRDDFVSESHGVSVSSRLSRRDSKYIHRIRRLGAEVSLPDRVMEYAGTILEEFPRVTDSHIAAALYASCIHYGIPRTEKELSSILSIPLKTLARRTSALRRSGIIPAESIDASTAFGRFVQCGTHDTFQIQQMAASKYKSRRHIHANVSVDTLVSQCVRDACLELNPSHGNHKP